MPCSIYKGAQRRLCYATDEWKDWGSIKKKKYRNRYKKNYRRKKK